MGTTLTPFNPGQLTQLGSNINIAVATALPNVAAKFDPKSLLKALEGKGQFVADKLTPALEQIFNSLFVLGTPGRINVTLAKQHDPDKFFRTGSGLYVYSGFQSHIVSSAMEVEVGSNFTLNHAILTKNMTDGEIEEALHTEHLFDESAVCAVIATMITDQPNGEEGKLLNNGYANLFYTSSCVVGVDWDADDREWRVDTWYRGDDGWLAGDRVFSLATAA